MSRAPWARAAPCSECPYRLDVPPGQFPPERYEALAASATQALGPVFACHKTAEGRDQACAGWLAVCGLTSITGRLAAANGRWQPADYADMPGLHTSYADMAEANGVPDNVLDALLGEDR